MVEHAIKNDAYAAAVAVGNKLQGKSVGGGPLPSGGVMKHLFFDKRNVADGVGTQVRIHMVVHKAVVFVVRGRPKNRVEVEGGDAEALQIVEFIDDALQIAPIPAAREVVQEALAVGLFPRLLFVPITGPGVDLPSIYRIV